MHEHHVQCVSVIADHEYVQINMGMVLTGNIMLCKGLITLQFGYHEKLILNIRPSKPNTMLGSMDVSQYLPLSSLHCLSSIAPIVCRILMARPDQKGSNHPCSRLCASPEWSHPPPKRKRRSQKSSSKSTASTSLMEK